MFVESRVADVKLRMGESNVASVEVFVFEVLLLGLCAMMEIGAGRTGLGT